MTEQKEIGEIKLVIHGKQQVLQLTQILNMVLKAHGLRYCTLCADLQQQIVNQVKDDIAAVYPGEQEQSSS